MVDSISLCVLIKRDTRDFSLYIETKERLLGPREREASHMQQTKRVFPRNLISTVTYLSRSIKTNV